jgi:hypothetical protein
MVKTAESSWIGPIDSIGLPDGRGIMFLHMPDGHDLAQECRQEHGVNTNDCGAPWIHVQRPHDDDDRRAKSAGGDQAGRDTKGGVGSTQSLALGFLALAMERRSTVAAVASVATAGGAAAGAAAAGGAVNPVVNE